MNHLAGLVCLITGLLAITVAGLVTGAVTLPTTFAVVFTGWGIFDATVSFALATASFARPTVVRAGPVALLATCAVPVGLD